jgi:hypothetical protein
MTVTNAVFGKDRRGLQLNKTDVTGTPRFNFFGQLFGRCG